MFYAYLQVRFNQLNYKYLYLILILIIEVASFFIVRQIQNDIRPYYTNVVLNSLPSFVFAFGLTLLVWILLRSTFIKAILFSISVSVVHEVVRWLDDGVLMDVLDFVFIILGVVFAAMFQFFILYLLKH